MFNPDLRLNWPLSQQRGYVSVLKCKASKPRPTDVEFCISFTSPNVRAGAPPGRRIERSPPFSWVIGPIHFRLYSITTIIEEGFSGKFLRQWLENIPTQNARRKNMPQTSTQKTFKKRHVSAVDGSGFSASGVSGNFYRSCAEAEAQVFWVCYEPVRGLCRTG